MSNINRTRYDSQYNPIPDVAGGQIMKPSKVMEGGLIKMFETYVNERLSAARTMVPAKIISVDYKRSLVNVKPLIRTVFDPVTMEEVEIQEVLEVPILFQSAKGGKARMTFPLQEGNTGLLLFSDRRTEKYLASNGLEVQDSGDYFTLGTNYILNVIGFLPDEFFTYSAEKPFDQNDVVLTHGTAITIHKEDGTIINKNTKATSTINANGDITQTNSQCSVTVTEGGDVSITAPTSLTITVGSATFSMSPDGTIKLNDFIIAADSSATSPVSVGAPTMTAASSLTVAGKEMSGHTHEAGSYVVGTDQVTGNSGEPV